MNLHDEPSLIVTVAHIVLVLVVFRRLAQAVGRAEHGAGGEPAQVRRRVIVFTALLVVWLGSTFAIAQSGVLLDFEARPPRMLFLMLPAFVGTAILAMTGFGALLLRGLPLWMLIGYQAFRIPVELILWRLSREGVLPERMTFVGSNWDIVSGVSALFVSAALQRNLLTKWALWVWNLISLGLLVNIVQIAIRSMPGPLQAWSEPPANPIVLLSVFIWVPTFYVLTAWFGHVLVFRALLRRDAALC